MNVHPKFSIILPIYKVEKYLSACIDSILDQTYTGFELILVDDGSPDNCPQICDDYAKKDNRIKVIHKPNGGLADARNVGLEMASGDYICYIDSDDYLIDENVLKLLEENLVTSPDIVHYKNVDWLESDGRIIQCSYNYKVHTENRSIYAIYCDLIDQDAYYNSAWSKIIRRDLLIDNNIRFEKGIFGEDNDWYYQVVMVAKTVVLIDKPLYVYRRRSGSITTSLSEKNLRDQLYVIEKWTTELQKKTTSLASKVIYGSLAKQYCSALIIYARIEDAQKYFSKLKKYSYLLNYSKTRRVLIFRYMTKLFGVSGVINLVKLINKLKK